MNRKHFQPQAEGKIKKAKAKQNLISANSSCSALPCDERALNVAPQVQPRPAQEEGRGEVSAVCWTQTGVSVGGLRDRSRGRSGVY